MEQNIKQITNYDISSLPTTQKQITIGGIIQNYDYKVITLIGSITKLGYCCEPKGIGYPIFLTFNTHPDQEKEIEIGKTGMYEYQEEEWMDLNDEETEVQTAIVYTIKVLVPVGIKFTLDYYIKQ